ncbi:hypothetical protein HC251_25195 (plasmid) [Iamia sp. SCSIO 61187]|uniref:TIGR02391 family protein n=1 Tax=Iamia sp. SCSIO 61187 TaxID=2722752 RepID=UPI001C637CD4|nr:TIGR02391 family protein [Iamia sp. SCSIO 61187]QYG95847.1 hypothetical protein HC251_25195 [Iamia sp. SCSIO 61187]
MDVKAAEARTRQALRAIDALFEAHDVIRVTDRWDDPDLQRTVTEAEDEVMRELLVMRAIADEVAPDAHYKLAHHRDDAYHGFAMARAGVVEVLAELTTMEDIEAIVGPAGPKLAGSALHPEIWAVSARRWDSGHPDDAVRAASTAIELMLQERLGRHDEGGVGLAAAFAPDDPSERWPMRLRISGLKPGSRTWTSAHEGAVALIRGAFLFVRNLVSHPSPDLTEAEALERLALLSMLARMIESAEEQHLPEAR